MNRRQFILRSLAVATVAGTAWIVRRLWSAPADVSRGEALRIAGILVPAFGGSPAVGAVGQAYLEKTPGESDPRVLVSHLCEGWAPDALDADASELVERIRQQHRQDFASGRTVGVEGWVLSRTEARVGALAALP
jgi:hypothetical protein